MATINIPRGYSFRLQVTNNEQFNAERVVSLALVRNGYTTQLGTFGVGTDRSFPTVLENAQLQIAGRIDHNPTLESGYDPDTARADIKFYRQYVFFELSMWIHIEKTKRFESDAIPMGTSLVAPTAADDEVIRLGVIASTRLKGLAAFVSKLDDGKPIGPSDFSDLPFLRDQLNPEEKILFDEDPIVGARVLLHAKAALSAAEDLYAGAELHNGNGDAFRHFYWNFLMTENTSVGERWAERWGNAHEDTLGNPPLEKTMDLHNNNVGRKLGLTGAADDPPVLRAAVRNGACRVIRNGALVRSDNAGEI
jgi:hypothetical protein